MVEVTQKQVTIAGILLAIIITGTSTYYLQPTGEYANCRAEWTQNDDGTYTCPKNDRVEECYDIESRGSGWYRCWIGERVDILNNTNDTEQLNDTTDVIKTNETEIVVLANNSHHLSIIKSVCYPPPRNECVTVTETTV